MTLKNIVTHGGSFHADEVLAIALLKEVGFATLEVKRTFKVTPEELEDPQTLVVDVGGVFDLASGNLDHHHNGDLPASNVMALAWAARNGYLSYPVARELKAFFSRVSDIDRKGPVVAGEQATEFSGMIRRMTDFGKAVKFARYIVRDLIASAKRSIKDRKRAMREISVNGAVGVQCTNSPILCWKDQLDIVFLITPGREAGTWNVISRDSQAYPILKGTETAGFVHAAKFMAVFASIDDAKVCADLNCEVAD